MYEAYARDGTLEIGSHARILQPLGHAASPYIRATSMPDVGFQLFELLGIVIAASHTHRLLANKEHTLRDQLVQFPKHFYTHVLRVFTQGDNLIVLSLDTVQ